MCKQALIADAGFDASSGDVTEEEESNESLKRPFS
jgi:hypothetical protein